MVSVELRGKPGSSLAVRIMRVVNDPPTITPSASPLPNRAGWNNSNLTISFTCACPLTAAKPEKVTIPVWKGKTPPNPAERAAQSVLDGPSPV